MRVYTDAPMDIKAFVETGETVHLTPTPVVRFEAGRGRPDRDMLHQVVDMLDCEAYTIFNIREIIADYLNSRETAG